MHHERAGIEPGETCSEGLEKTPTQGRVPQTSQPFAIWHVFPFFRAPAQKFSVPPGALLEHNQVIKTACVDGAPEKLTATQKRDAIKAAGGAAYEALLAQERTARAEFRKRYPEKIRAERKRHEKSRPGYLKKNLVLRARRRGRKAGMEATVRASDIHWPTHCPVLGIELDYSPPGQRKAHNPANPSLDRWDNTKGYVPGNVFVISMRANALKSNATWQELQAVVRYARDGLSFMKAVA